MGKQAEDLGAPGFKVFSHGMHVIKTADGEEAPAKKQIRVIASSSVKDRHGDTMTEHCVRSMAKQAQGMTIFRNHQYRVPEDVFGTVQAARTKRLSALQAKQAGFLEKGSTSSEDVLLLELDVNLFENATNLETYAAVEDGITLGVSIGANLTDYEEDPDSDKQSWFPPLIINDVDLLEASIVGIPANPLSWVEGATKSVLVQKGVLGTRATRKDLENVLKAKEAPSQIDTDDTGFPKTDDVIADAEDALEGDPETNADPPADDPAAEEPEEPKSFDGPEEIVAHYQIKVEQGIMSRTDLDAVEDAIQGAIDFAKANGGSDVFEGVSAKELTQQVFANQPSSDEEENEPDEASGDPESDQEAPSSDPESADAGDEEVEKQAAAELEVLRESGVMQSITGLSDALGDALVKLARERRQVTVLQEQLAAETQRADQAHLAATQSFSLLKEVMGLPVGRKMTARDTVKTGLDRLKGGPYNAEVLRIIHGTEGVQE